MASFLEEVDEDAAAADVVAASAVEFPEATDPKVELFAAAPMPVVARLVPLATEVFPIPAVPFEAILLALTAVACGTGEA